MKKLSFFTIVFLFCSFCISEGALAAACSFAVIGNQTDGSPSQINNIYTMLDNLEICYKPIRPSEVDASDFDDVDAIISFAGTSSVNNPQAVVEFAADHVVISHGWDFEKYYYPEYSSSLVKSSLVKTSNITYLMNRGNFREGDKAIFHRGVSSNDGDLRVFSASQFASDEPITKIAEVDSDNVAIFKYGGNGDNGFYVMDLMATSDDSELAGIWHIFPAVKMVEDFPTGKYARWMSNVTRWYDLEWVNNFIFTLVDENSDIAEKEVIGQSLEGKDINAIIIGKGNRYALIDGCIHGNEKTTAFSGLRLAELLIEYYRYDPSWKAKLDQYKVIIIPVLNPDAFVRNRRFNSRSILEPDGYNKAGTASVVNGSWITHGLSTGSGVEDRRCYVTTDDPDINAGVFSVNSEKFQVELLWSDDTPVTTPQSVTWDCHEHCCNLNRHFPPGADTEEPEVLALIDLIKSKKPKIYVNMHEGCCWYPNIMSHSPASHWPFSSFIEYAVYQAADTFANLQHWGRFIASCNNGCNKPIDRVNGIWKAGHDSTAHYYGGWEDDRPSVLLESIVWSPTFGAKQGLYGLDYYISIALAFLKHYDYDTDYFLYVSDGFITNTIIEGDTLRVKLDTSELTGPSTTFIRDVTDRGMPTEVHIDGIKKDEGDGWNYYSGSKNITITGATDLIVINWGEPILEPELVGYWKFEGNMLDSSTYGNDGSCTNCPSTTPGKLGSAYYFDGVNDYIKINDDSTLDINDAITIGAWVYPTSWSSDYPRIVSKESGRSAQPYALELANSAYTIAPYSALLCLDTGSGEDCVNSGTNSISLNQWYHVVGVWNSTHSQIYLNGTQKGIKTLTGAMVATANDVLIGNNPTDERQFNGIIDEVKIWDGALNPNEIMNEYIKNNLIGYWKFDEGSGTAVDSSSFNNDGIINGAIWSSTDCKSGSCLSFDGNNDYVFVSDSLSLDSPTSTYTFMAWVKPYNAGEDSLGRVLDKGQAGGGWAIYTCDVIGHCTDEFRFWLNSATQFDSGDNTIIYDGWNHIALMQNTSGLYWFVNGLMTNKRSILTLNPTNENLYIGNREDLNRTFNGIIDEVKIYNYALTENEIVEEHNRICNDLCLDLERESGECKSSCEPGEVSEDNGCSSGETCCCLLPGEPTSCEILLERVQDHLNTECCQSGYDRVADVNKDKIIDVGDQNLVSQNIYNIEWCDERLNDYSSPCRCGGGCGLRCLAMAWYTMPYLLEVTIPFVIFVIISIAEIIVLVLIIRKLNKR
ncbi:MAG: hypothetical protein GTN36_06420 [Candidatus Aenigmarchaeota archaeon]|nr:hypothetical protein [Candidatus Aenigmarchaeota archaeon]